MTPILKVIGEYCSIYVDDIRLSDLAQTDAPLYARRMWQYFQPAINLFNLPAEMPTYLLGTVENPKLITPSFTNTLYTVNQDYNTEFEISLGTDFAGYELCACRIRQIYNNNEIIYSPIDIEYNTETGTVTVYATSDNPIESGTVLDFDFYTDGYFIETLSAPIMNILGICFQIVWQERFNTEWLSMVTKIEDKTFSEQNRANKMRADTERITFLRHKLAAEMRRFEQNLYYKKYVINPINI